MAHHQKEPTYGPNEHFQKLSNTYGRDKFTDDQVFSKDYSSEEDLEALCEVILQDPRYNRLVQIWNPKISNKRGLKQKVKNLVDPIHLPYVGTFLMWKRVRDAEDSREKMAKLNEDTENQPINSVINPMANNAQVNVAGQTAKASAKTFFMFFPIVYAIPGGDPLVSKLAEKGAVKSAQKTAQSALSDDTLDSAAYDANDKWGATKAFIIYLGLPRNNDKIYHTWEDSRLRLKQFFGVGPDEDVAQMEPKDQTLKALEEAEETKGGYDLQALNVPLLVLLWRIYDCWDQPYADKLTSKKHKVKRDDKWRLEDERQVLELINPVDPHIQKLDSTSQKSVSRMIRSEAPTGYGKHTIFNFLEERSDTKKEKRLKWMIDTFVKKLTDAETGWGYYSERTANSEQGELLAVIFFERAEEDHYDPSDLLSTMSGMMKLQGDYKNISSRLSWEASAMKHNTDAKNMPGILHMFACQDSTEGREALIKLIQSETQYTSVPSYCQEYEAEHERLQLLERAGFTPKTNLSTEENDRLTYDSKSSNSPRLKIYQYQPRERGIEDYTVPRVIQPAQHPVPQAHLDNKAPVQAPIPAQPVPTHQS